MADAHLTSNDVAAYLGPRLAQDDRRRVEAHLALCSECRAEVREVRSMLQSAPSARRSRAPAIALLGAAAAALLLLVTPWSALRRPGTATSGIGAERSVLPDAGRDSVQIVAPALDESVAPRSLRLVWRRGSRDAQFTVTLLNAQGDIRWSTTTRDSSVVVPDSVALASEATWVVYVDALRSDGTSARSSPRTFTVRR